MKTVRVIQKQVVLLSMTTSQSFSQSASIVALKLCRDQAETFDISAPLACPVLLMLFKKCSALGEMSVACKTPHLAAKYD